MKIIDLDPLKTPHWTQLVERNNSDVFHSPQWFRILTQTYDFNIRAILLMNEDGMPIAGIPYIKIEDLFSPRIIALPFSDYCDPIVSSDSEWEKICAKLISQQYPMTVRCLHNRIPLNDSRFKRVNRARWHGIDVSSSTEEIYKKIHSSSRRAIQKAHREGITVRLAEKETDLRFFFNLHLKVRKRKYRLLAQPYSFFKNIWHNFIEKHQGILMLAEYNSKIISGVLFLKWKNRLYYKFNASDIKFQKLRANDFLMWEGIKYAKKNNLNYLDLGLSDWDQEGLIRYKRKFASEEKTISFLHYDPAGKNSYQDQQLRQLIPQLTDLFTDESVPNTITEKAGEILYRFFI